MALSSTSHTSINDDISQECTIADVARVAGVSPATVSRSFSKPSKVSPHTLHKVLSAAQQLGYHRTLTQQPQSEHNALHGILAIVVTDIDNPISVRIARGSQQFCKLKQYSLIIEDTEEDVEAERHSIQRILDHVDGIILDSSRLPESVIRNIASAKPTVVLNRPVQGVASITTDCKPSLREVIQQLHTLGHTSLSYVAGPDNSWQNSQRKEAIRQQCETLGMKLRILPCAYPHAHNVDTAFNAYMRYPTSAIIAFDDSIALEFMHRLAELGITIPQQVSIVGINDISLCKTVIPSLTSIEQPYEYMGRTAAQYLIHTLLHTSEPDDMQHGLSHQITSTLHIRQSIGPVNPLMRAREY